MSCLVRLLISGIRIENMRRSTNLNWIYKQIFLGAKVTKRNLGIWKFYNPLISSSSIGGELRMCLCTTHSHISAHWSEYSDSTQTSSIIQIPKKTHQKNMQNVFDVSGVFDSLERQRHDIFAVQGTFSAKDTFCLWKMNSHPYIFGVFTISDSHHRVNCAQYIGTCWILSVADLSIVFK